MVVPQMPPGKSVSQLIFLFVFVLALDDVSRSHSSSLSKHGDCIQNMHT